MTTIERMLSDAKTEALKLKHHLPTWVAITTSVAKQHSTFLTGDVSVYGKYAYVPCGVINHVTLKETLKTVKVLFHKEA
jgi:hypothetical protein